MPEIYDIAIIGTGPAGVSAALTAKARNLNMVWFGNKDISKKVSLAEQIHNYPGLIQVSGREMQETFQKPIEAEELAITEKVINQIFPMGKQYALFSGQESWMAKTVLLAMGMAPSTTMKGEAEFLGKGVSYCATCDGRLYTGKKIAVYCTNPEFEPEVEFLADLAGEVWVYPSYKDFSVARDNIRILSEAPVEVCGEDFVSGIRLKNVRASVGDQDSVADTKEQRVPGNMADTGTAFVKESDVIPVDGIFCLKDSYSPVTLVRGLEMEGSHIKVNRRQETNITGCYAAGDCTGRPYQYAKAVGEGNVAVHSILDYLHSAE
jgi:thioredoxin reductase (NADPH)